MKTVRVHQYLDEKGKPEEFTFDLYGLENEEVFAHLAEDGLPLAGTRLRVGMILVGKLACTKLYDRRQLPRSVDYAFYGEEAMVEKLKTMIRSTSYRVTPAEEGVVVQSYFEGEAPHLTAVVEIDDQRRGSMP